MPATERFFNSRNEEYEAASWLSTLKVMQRLAERTDGNGTTVTRLSSLVLHKPDEFLDEFWRYASSANEIEMSEKTFLREIGASKNNGQIVRGLSDAALLLCNDPVSQVIKEQSSFARLIPLIEEMADYCDTKFIKNARHDDLKATGYPVRLRYVRTEADFYIREYDGPEVVVIRQPYL